MNIWDNEAFDVVYRENKYTVTQMEIDISEAWEKPLESVLVSHKFESTALPTTIYMINDFSEGSFGFGHKVIEDEKDSGLFVTLQDEDLYEKMVSLVMYIDELYNKEDI